MSNMVVIWVERTSTSWRMNRYGETDRKTVIVGSHRNMGWGVLLFWKSTVGAPPAKYLYVTYNLFIKQFWLFCCQGSSANDFAAYRTDCEIPRCSFYLWDTPCRFLNNVFAIYVNHDWTLSNAHKQGENTSYAPKFPCQSFIWSPKNTQCLLKISRKYIIIE